jgi:hypothetical protein
VGGTADVTLTNVMATLAPDLQPLKLQSVLRPRGRQPERGGL